MIDPGSSMQGSPAIVCDKVGSGSVNTIPLRLDISSAQSHHFTSAWHHDSVKYSRSYDRLPRAFSGARTHSPENIQVSTNACLETQYTTPAQVPVETTDVSLILLEMDSTAEKPPPYFYPIHALHFTEWDNYNAQYDSPAKSPSEPEDSVQSKIDVRELLEMLKNDYYDIANVKKPISCDREQEFSWEQNINPSVWTVILNSNLATFLPRKEHLIVANTNKEGKYFPITMVDVLSWQHFFENPWRWRGRAKFLENRNINYRNFSAIVDTTGELRTPLNELLATRNPQENIFVSPKFPGISNQFSKPITPECLRSWNEKKMMHDYGIIHYFSKTEKWSPEMEKEVYFLRKCQENRLILTAEDVTHRCNGAPVISEKIVTGVTKWDRMSELERLGYAIGQFSSQHSLDALCWCFLVWSNELAIEKWLMPEGEKVKKISHKLDKVREMLKMRLQKVIEYRWPTTLPEPNKS